jgi:hypothetical protein
LLLVVAACGPTAAQARDGVRDVHAAFAVGMHANFSLTEGERRETQNSQCKR